jgi:hypothetical protein
LIKAKSLCLCHASLKDRILKAYSTFKKIQEIAKQFEVELEQSKEVVIL